jgi:hypothetical protein
MSLRQIGVVADTIKLSDMYWGESVCLKVMKRMTYRLSGHARRSAASFATPEGRLLVVSISRAAAHHPVVHLYT